MLLKLLAIKLFGEFRIDAEIEKGTKIGFSCFKLIRQVWIASQIRLRKKIKSPSRI